MTRSVAGGLTHAEEDAGYRKYQDGDGRDDVHVCGSVLPQCRGLLPQKVRAETGRGPFRSDGEESVSAGQARHGVC